MNRPECNDLFPDMGASLSRATIELLKQVLADTERQAENLREQIEIAERRFRAGSC